ncbi:hypothetical protein MYCO108962_04930 [Mycobacterium colombiense]
MIDALSTSGSISLRRSPSLIARRASCAVSNIRFAKKRDAAPLNPLNAVANCAAARAILSEFTTSTIVKVPCSRFSSPGDDAPHTLRKALRSASEPSSMMFDANDSFESKW